MELHEKLKELRVRKGYSQAYVAEKLNITRQAISKWENGWTYPDVDNLKLLSTLYGVTTDELLQIFSNQSEDPEQSEKRNLHNEHYLSEKILWLLAAIATTIIPFGGLALDVWIFIQLKQKKMELPGILIAMIVICFLINLGNSLLMLNNLFFHMGKATVL